MKILYLASEAVPFIKVGGLGDVAGSLPPAIQQVALPEKIDIRLAIPFHGELQRLSLPLRFIISLVIPHYPQPALAQVYQLENAPVTTYLIGGSLIPQDAPVYTADSTVDGRKYTFFSLAALAFAQSIEWQPDIVHANDWHTSPALYAIYLRQDPFFASTGKVLTIHNLPYLGHGAAEALGEFGLPPAINSRLPIWAQHLPLPLGLISADRIIAVSPTYAQEILTEDFSSGLDDFLLTRKNDLLGILNGIDLDSWNPATDQNIPVQFDAQHLEKKIENKRHLLEEINLPFIKNTPLLGMVTRMDYQKGIDLALSTLRMARDLPWQAVILGTGNPVLEEDARQLELELPDRFRALIRFDPHLSRKVYAAADILLMPSRYEPCGLAQMIAMRYGTLPLASATGGLKDTIQDHQDPNISCGFLFSNPDPQELIQTLQRSIAVYQHPKQWQKMQKNAMRQDFSWTRSAYEYLSTYRQLLSEIKKKAPRRNV